ncbi:MAG: tripartite tricarboxylate transporter TctB family protein [Pseudomonadota bacterium]
MERSERAGVLAEYALWLTLAVFFFVYSFEFADPNSPNIISAEVWPRIFAVVVAIVATIYTAEKLSAKVEALERPKITLAGILGFAQLVAAPLVYAYLLPRAGFFVATPLFLVAQLVALGERRPAVIAAVAAGVFALVCIVFTTVFYVALPVGNWPAFYDINNAIVSALR